jgi:predicted transcriptional regulator
MAERTSKHWKCPPATRLETFMRANGIKPAELARESAISRQHLLRLRNGTADPTRAVMVAITSACSTIARRRVSMSALFDLRGGKR